MLDEKIIPESRDFRILEAANAAYLQEVGRVRVLVEALEGQKYEWGCFCAGTRGESGGTHSDECDKARAALKTAGRGL